jgi:hypothetical protein
MNMFGVTSFPGRAVLLAVALAFSSTTWAQDEPLPGKFEIEIGGFFVTEIDTVVQFAKKAGPIEAGTIIDFSKDLGLSDSESIPRMDGFYRFNKRSSLNFSLWNIERDATTFLGRGIDFGNISIPAGELVESFFDTRTIRVSYGYSFYNVPKAELGFNAGLHVTTFDLGSNCISCTTAETLDSERITAPLPVLGFHFRYQISRRWKFSGYTQHFLLEVGVFDGSLTDTRISFSHHTFKNVGFGFGWNRIQTDLDIDTSHYVMAIDNKLDGVQVFLIVYAGKPKSTHDSTD